MEINVGDYVRYKEFSYDKEVKIGKKVDVFGNVDTSRGRILEHNIIKHSKNIIDLIEVGDYVNGSKVLEIEKDYKFIDGTIGDILWTDTKMQKAILNETIKSILTHEQFEANAYTIEKER